MTSNRRRNVSNALCQHDLNLRGALTRSIAELGHAPTCLHLAEMCDYTLPEVQASLARLQHAHCLQLHPGTHEPWVVHPFALSPGSCWVDTEARGWWANCLYCAMGIAAAVGTSADIHTRIGGESETLTVRIRDGHVDDGTLLFHLSTPFRHWWDNVIHACATFQPFRSEDEIDDWCRRHALPMGAVMASADLWDFAKDWYGDYISEPWRKRTDAEASSVFARHGLTGHFWALA